jgi:hypothetical protein
VSLGASWGAGPEERTVALPCDELLPRANVRLHRAVSIDAPTAVVFRWLCQLKSAPYSYDLLDNFGRRSPRTLTPGAERLEAGQRFMSLFALSSFTPSRQITLRARRTAVTYATTEREAGTRLLVRVLFEIPGPQPVAVLAGHALALGDLVMMRKQLLTLKSCAENQLSTPR